MKNRTKRPVLCLCAALLLAGAVALGLYLKSLSDYRRAVAGIRFEGIDAADVADGVYTGEYDVGFVYARVRVTVHGGVLEQVEILEHKNGRGAPAESVIQAMTERQSVYVDTVSGATNSSLVLEKAAENALRQGLPCG